MHSFGTLTQTMRLYHLLKAANTEVVSNFLKSTMEFECSIYRCWLINNDVWCLEQFGSVVASDLIPCKTLKDFCKSPYSVPGMMLSML